MPKEQSIHKTKSTNAEHEYLQQQVMTGDQSAAETFRKSTK